MRLLCAFVLCCLCQACETYDYYVIAEGDNEVTDAMLYKDEYLTVSYRVYNGLISRVHLGIEENNDFEIAILSYEHSLSVNENSYTPSIIGDYGLGIVNFHENGRATITSKFEFDENPESLIESVEIQMSIDGDLITISKEFHLIKRSYSRFEASH